MHGTNWGYVIEVKGHRGEGIGFWPGESLLVFDQDEGMIVFHQGVRREGILAFERGDWGEGI